MNKQQFIDIGIAADLAEKAVAASEAELKGYVSKEEHNTVVQERDTAQGQVKDRDAQLKKIQDEMPDNEKLQNSILTMQADNKTKDETHAKELAQVKLDSKLDIKLLQVARNEKAATGLRALLDHDKISLDGKVLTGVDDQLEALQKAEDTNFYFKPAKEETKPPAFKGANLAEGGDKTNENQPVTLNGALAAHFNTGQE